MWRSLCFKDTKACRNVCEKNDPIITLQFTDNSRFFKCNDAMRLYKIVRSIHLRRHTLRLVCS